MHTLWGVYEKPIGGRLVSVPETTAAPANPQNEVGFALAVKSIGGFHLKPRPGTEARFELKQSRRPLLVLSNHLRHVVHPVRSSMWVNATKGIPSIWAVGFRFEEALGAVGRLLDGRLLVEEAHCIASSGLIVGTRPTVTKERPSNALLLHLGS